MAIKSKTFYKNGLFCFWLTYFWLLVKKLLLKYVKNENKNYFVTLNFLFPPAKHTYMHLHTNLTFYQKPSTALHKRKNKSVYTSWNFQFQMQGKAFELQIIFTSVYKYSYQLSWVAHAWFSHISTQTFTGSLSSKWPILC